MAKEEKAYDPAQEALDNVASELKDSEGSTSTSPAPERKESQPTEAESQVDANDLKNTSEEVEEEQSEEIDYQAELSRLEEERDNYKQGMLNAKAKLKEGKDDVEEEDVQEANFEEVTRAAQDAVKEQLEKYRMEDRIDVIDDSITSVSMSPEEAKLVKFHYENTINKSGFSRQAIARDIQKAKLLANEKKILQENRELAQALASKASVSGSALGSSYRKKNEPEPALSEADKRVLARRGLKPSDVKLD